MSEPRLVRVAGKSAWHVYWNRTRRSAGTTDRKEAEEFLANIKKGLAKPKSAIVSVSEILDRYLDDRRELNVPGAGRLEYAHKPLKAFFGHRTPATLTTKDSLAYAAKRKGVSVATVRTELSALRAALRWATTENGGRLFAEVPAIPMPKRPPGKERWLTRDEADRLLQACSFKHLKLFVLIGLNTAARRGAILDLTWDRVDLVNRRIDFRRPGEVQTRKRKVAVPINDTLLPALQAAQEEATTPYVIEWSGGRVENVKHGFAGACQKAGLKNVTPHTLRHTAVTWMMQKGVSAWDAAGLAGMTVEMVSEVYGKHAPDFLKGAANALG